MSEFMKFMHEQEKVATARSEYNAASLKLDNANIRCRLAELESQHEPLASLLKEPLGERERLYAAAFWVVVGRMPEKVKP